MTTATLVIDMQVDFFAHERLARNRVRLAGNINRVLRASREYGAPVIWIKTEFAPDLHDALLEVRKKQIPVVVRGTEGAGILPELEFLDTDTLLIKKRYSAFFDTPLDSQLRENGCYRLIVCGINTHACIRTTVIDAYQRDYEVVLAKDCIDSHDLEHHEVSWRYMDGKLGVGMGTVEVCELLAKE